MSYFNSAIFTMKKLLFSILFPLAFVFNSASAQTDSIRISLLTCDPGIKIYELYGHTAIRIENQANSSDIVFNYGLFDFNTPHFIWRFSLGKTDYLLGVDYFKNFEQEYRHRGSAIYEQELNISQDEAHKILSLLYENYKPENRSYRYDFLHNNCATMALDKIEECISGQITYSGIDSTESFRSILKKYNRVEPWSEFGVNLVLGADADLIIANREHAFAPIELKDMIANAYITDSIGNQRPLAVNTIKIVDPGKSLIYPNNPMPPMQTMSIVLLVTLLICLIDWYRKKTSWWFDIVIFGAQGLAGLLIAFLYFFSEHPTVNSNWLIIGLNPVPLFWLPFLIRNQIKQKPDAFFLADFLVMTTFIILSKAFPQEIQISVLVLFAIFALRSLSNYLLLFLLKHGKIKSSKNKINKTVLTLILLVIGINISAQNSTNRIVSNARPKLIVGIVIDQLSTEKLEKLMPLMGNDGIKQIWMEGYNRPNVFHEFDDPDLASAVASIYSGTVPFNHGIVASRWMDRKTMNVNSLTDDSNQTGINTIERASPKKLLSTNLADQIKISTEGRGKVCSISIDREGAIFSAGHEGDVAMWMNNTDDRWCTSNYYGGLPAWTTPLNDSIWQNCEWEPVFPTGFYLQKSDEERYQPFSYTFKKNDAWNFRFSPMANNKVTSMAIAALDGMELGKDNNPDLLMLTLYAGNYVLQSQNVYSLEQQDIYIRLDQNIADLKRKIDENIGLENVLFFLTSSGQFKKEIPDLSNTRIPNGQISMERVTALLNLYLSAKLGQGSYIETYHNNQLYLNKELLENKNISLLEITECCMDFLSQVSGVKSVTSQRSLMSGLMDQATTRKRNGLHPIYSGDLILNTNPGWIIIDEMCATKYCQPTQYEYFPMIIWGNGIRAEINHDPISISVLAPTIAYFSGIGIPNACTTPPLKNLK